MSVDLEYQYVLALVVITSPYVIEGVNKMNIIFTQENRVSRENEGVGYNQIVICDG